ncbi:ubiquitin-conjugating enzyme/RWD-like protein [Gautieria morchelliformis]|nr:ubiquitin-conjugating enzyme/RWD-like protein [Gautieria morchelliformis]
MQHCPLGVYVVPSDTLLHWDGVLFLHQGLLRNSTVINQLYISSGYYADAVLKFRLTFPRNFPEQPPSVHFVTDVFHPLVSQQDGRFNLAPRFHSWRPKEHHVFDVLHWIKAAFKRVQLDQLQENDCLNKDAFRYRDATSSFAALAAQTSALSNSKSALYDRDHPSMAKQRRDSLPFCELNQEGLHDMRSKLGLQEWVIENSTEAATGD